MNSKQDVNTKPLIRDICLPVYDLKEGMFVSNVDCGWRKTPFLLEGLLVTSAEEISILNELTEFVTVDPVRSEDFVLNAYLEKNVDEYSGLGDAEANTFSNSAAFNTDVVEPLIPATDEELAKHRINAIAASRFSFSAWLSQLLKGRPQNLVPTPEEKTPELQTRTIRPTYLPSSIELVRHEEPEFSWPALRMALGTCKETVTALEQLTDEITRYKMMDVRKIQRAATSLADNMVAYPDAMIWASRIREKNTQHFQRCLQTAIYLTALGRYLGFTRKLLAELATIGILLDLGKMKLDSDLLSKQGSFNADEMRTAQMHVDLGIAMLLKTGTLPESVLRAIAEHHEQINGKGYPKGLAGADISIFGKMAAIADAYVAMVNQRPYAEILAPHEAIKELFAGANTRWFGPLVEQFVQSIGIFPTGSLVELASGHIAIVIQHNRVRRLEPKVLIVTHSDKRRRSPPLQIDILTHNERKKKSRLQVRKGLPDGSYGIDVQDFYSRLQ